MSSDGVDGIWVRQLQKLLVDMGIATEEDSTGSYDHTTAAKIREFQRDNRLPATGEVDQETWDSLRRKGCKLYDS
jgi:peptidoglycan hydrolase-like protein with peptidoglycan-binding domain